MASARKNERYIQLRKEVEQSIDYYTNCVGVTGGLKEVMYSTYKLMYFLREHPHFALKSNDTYVDNLVKKSSMATALTTLNIMYGAKELTGPLSIESNALEVVSRCAFKRLKDCNLVEIK